MERGESAQILKLVKTPLDGAARHPYNWPSAGKSAQRQTESRRGSNQPNADHLKHNYRGQPKRRLGATQPPFPLRGTLKRE